MAAYCDFTVFPTPIRETERERERERERQKERDRHNRLRKLYVI